MRLNNQDNNNSAFSLRIVVAGEQCKVTGELLRKSKALSGNERNLAGEFCVVDGEFSDFRCLMNTLIIAVCKLAFIENLCSLL